MLQQLSNCFFNKRRSERFPRFKQRCHVPVMRREVALLKEPVLNRCERQFSCDEPLLGALAASRAGDSRKLGYRRVLENLPRSQFQPGCACACDKLYAEDRVTAKLEE